LLGSVLLLLWPVLFWRYPASCRTAWPLLLVLFGQKTLVAYPPTERLPRLKAGLFDPASGEFPARIKARIYSLYAKDYTAMDDLRLVLGYLVR